jgi:hypothetical protein
MPKLTPEEIEERKEAVWQRVRENQKVKKKLMAEWAQQRQWKVNAERKQVPAIDVDAPGPVKCPRCDSASLAAGNKGFSFGGALAGWLWFGAVGLLGGLLGVKEVVITCLNCGAQWSP